MSLNRYRGKVSIVLAFSGWCLLVAIGTFCGRASAQVSDVTSKPSLSAEGRILIGGAVGGYWADEPNKVNWRQWNRWEMQASPTVTYFVVDGVGLGLSAGGSIAEREQQRWDERTKSLHVGAHGVLAVKLSPLVSLMPKLSGSWMRSWNEFSWTVYPSTYAWPYSGETPTRFHSRHVAQWARAEVFLPVVFALSDRVGIGVGPTAWVDVFLSRDPPVRVDANDHAHRRFDPAQSARFQLGASTWIVLSL